MTAADQTTVDALVPYSGVLVSFGKQCRWVRYRQQGEAAVERDGEYLGGMSWDGSRVDLARMVLRAQKEAARRRVAWEGVPPQERRPRRRRRQDNLPVRVGEAVLELFSLSGDGFHDAARVISDWDGIAKELSRGLVPVTFDPGTGTLAVRATSEAWATQARLLGAKIVEKLNERLGSAQIRQLRVYKAAPPAAAPARPVDAPVAPELRAALERQAQRIRREPEELFQAACEAQARRAPTSQQQSALVRARALDKANRRAAS
ncbi:DciA family protein [Streptomyces sp. NPDC008222]|uniref:DciA family protein n=1 Tax=Streptomyces sp. NPDC008222 TaxID=3364820 RepID=UPI0036EC206D